MKIIIFGAGTNGKLLQKYIEKMIKRGQEDNSIVAFLDNKCEVSEIINKKGEKIPVIKPEESTNIGFDLILISNENRQAILNIKAQLKEIGIPEEKVVSLIEKEELMIEVFSNVNRYDEDTDFRVKWLYNFSVYAKEKGYIGNIAECGVNKGEFAYYMNKYFSDKRLYLFDTFSGFDEKDIKEEMEVGVTSLFFGSNIYRKKNFYINK